jgi:hypothetical protein
MLAYGLNSTSANKDLFKKAIKDNAFILDLGALEYYTSYKDWLLDYEIVTNKSIIIADGTCVLI